MTFAGGSHDTHTYGVTNHLTNCVTFTDVDCVKGARAEQPLYANCFPVVVAVVVVCLPFAACDCSGSTAALARWKTKPR